MLRGQKLLLGIWALTWLPMNLVLRPGIQIHIVAFWQLLWFCVFCRLLFFCDLWQSLCLCSLHIHYLRDLWWISVWGLKYLPRILFACCLALSDSLPFRTTLLTKESLASPTFVLTTPLLQCTKTSSSSDVILDGICLDIFLNMFLSDGIFANSFENWTRCDSWGTRSSFWSGSYLEETRLLCRETAWRWFSCCGCYCFLSAISGHLHVYFCLSLVVFRENALLQR